MTLTVQDWSEASALHTRIVVVGSDLLAGALASALETYKFTTMHIEPNELELERGIEWQPDLMLIDFRSLDVADGSAFIAQLHRAGLQVCVIDATDDDDRRTAWMRAGSSAVIDGSEPFDRLFQTIFRLLRIAPPARSSRRSPASLALSSPEQPQRDSRVRQFATLTHREQVVLAELMEGHCAEEIAKAAFVSISTIRSQIKSILQKLGVNSQLAAVAMARRAGWAIDSAPETSPDRVSVRGTCAS